jgi:3-oxoacyl-[acyl-carrier-protein] synthase III
MSFYSFNNCKVEYMSAAVPLNTVDNYSFGKDLLSDDELNKIIKTTGVQKRRIAPESICTSDLCFKASEQIFENSKIDKNKIDFLIFVTQTPDYRIPATAVILQDRLGLRKDCGAFDINLGCSGYVYGLLTTFMFMQNENVRRILLLVGDTVSKFVSEKDRTTNLLFGDAGSATLISKENNSNSYFSVSSDGSGANSLIIKGGGYRYPSSQDTLKYYEYAENSFKNDEQLFMSGPDIFNFALREIPKDINNLIAINNIDKEEIDYYIFHQANKFMIDFIAKKLKLQVEKYPYSIDKFGNTSSASIPLTIVSELKEKTSINLLLSGFGVGLSWASVYLHQTNINILPIIEV